MDAELPPGSEHRLVVDRREGEMVVVEVDGDAVIDLPSWMLPAEAAEGAVFRVRAVEDGEGWRIELRPDADSARAARRSAEEALQRLRRRDPGGDIVL